MTIMWRSRSERTNIITETPECPGITYGIYNYSKISKIDFNDFSKISDSIFAILEEYEIFREVSTIGTDE